MGGGPLPNLLYYPSISVIIPTRNAADGLRIALPAILDQEYPGSVEVFVADGSDTEETVELVRQRYPSVRLIPNPMRTISAGINRVLAVSSGEVVVRCDSYATFPPGYLRRAVETLIRTGAANVGGRQYSVGTSFVERAVATAQNSPLGSGTATYRVGRSEGPTDTVYLGVFRRTALEGIGGFDLTLLRNEDYDANWRIWQSGGMVWYDPALIVNYRPRSSFGTLMSQHFDYGRWKSVVVWRHPKSLRLRHIAAPLLTIGLGLSIIGHWMDVPLLLAFSFIYFLPLLCETVRLGVRDREPAVVLLPLVVLLMHLIRGVGFFCPPISIWKKGRGRILPSFSKESTERALKPSFADHEGGDPASPMSGRTNAGGQRSAVVNGAAGVAEAGPRVSAVILTWNSVGKIEPCLEALRQGTRIPDEIIVLDNGSTDQTLAVLAAKGPSIRVVESAVNRGVARGRNKGIMMGDGEYILMLDDDTVIDPEALVRMVSVLDTHPTVAACGPQLLDSARRSGALEGEFPTLWDKLRRWRSMSGQKGETPGNGMSAEIWDVAYVIGACILIRRTAMDEVGDFDEHIFYGPEDVDFCLRLRRAGWRVVVQTAAQVIHVEQRIARSMLSGIGRKHLFGLGYYFWKHRYGLSWKRLSTRLPNAFFPMNPSH